MKLKYSATKLKENYTYIEKGRLIWKRSLRESQLWVLLLWWWVLMAIGASASNGINWKVYTPAKTPAGSGITTDTKTVSGLSTSSDSAIDFVCGGFTGGSGSTYARCNIQSNMKKIQYSVCWSLLLWRFRFGSVKKRLVCIFQWR